MKPIDADTIDEGPTDAPPTPEAAAASPDLSSHRQMEMVTDITTRLVAEPDPAKVYEGILAGARRLLNANRCALFRVREDFLQPECLASQGLSQEYLDGLLQLGEDVPSAQPFKHWETTVYEDIQTDPRSHRIHEMAAREGVHTAIGAPLVFQGRLVGALALYFDAVRPVTPEDLHLFRLFASIAAAATESSRVYVESECRAERLRVLNDIGVAVSRTLDLDVLYDVVFHQAKRVLKAEAFYIALWNEERRKITFPFNADRGERLRSREECELNDGPCSWVIRNARPYVAQTASDPLQMAGQSFGDSEPSQSAMHVPMLLGDRVLGVMSAQSYEPDAYTDEDLRMLQMVAGQTAVAVENAHMFAGSAAAAQENERLHAESARRADRLLVLNETGLALSGALEMDALYDVVFQQASRVLPVDAFYIALWNADTELMTYAFYDHQKLCDKNVDNPIGDGPSGWVVRNRRSYVTRDVQADALHEAGSQYGSGPISQSAMHVPMLLGGQVIGVVSVQSYQPDAYTDEDLQMLETLAGQAAVAVENARLYKAVHEASLTDDLTGLPNRRALTRRLQDEMRRATRHGHSLCVLMMDLDYFKKVNDTYGHPAGDAVLRELATLLRRHLRSYDAIGRWGGEEFLMVLTHTDRAGGERVAENLRAAVAAQSFLEGRVGPTLSVSIGAVALEKPEATGVEMILESVDACLYRAKAAGRNRTVFHTTSS